MEDRGGPVERIEEHDPARIGAERRALIESRFEYAEVLCLISSLVLQVYLSGANVFIHINRPSNETLVEDGFKDEVFLAELKELFWNWADYIVIYSGIVVAVN
ncbi:unnamed protein product [Bursaphelenchus okinawaensis]|uniref:Uncharacterized protein n=1 Tax=Bursaphelenchus okinawaensis TaxID=465554 RepID=A0A811LU55_9BILA|nr:unnamed protein product [Bursaphelenchus okinawaensis]CAG9128105.1 unnamed protein product [Bursaphelenchus okinawaensis]